MSRHLRVIVLTALAVSIACDRQPRRTAREELVATASSTPRSIEPRLTGGFRWTPYVAGSMSGTSAILASATNILLQPTSRATPSAYLLTGKVNEAIARLETSTRELPNDAEAWSDLGAARYVRALTMDRPDQLPDALAAVDRAIALKRDLPEAGFNRALILEKMGLHAWAVEQWRNYARKDRSEWAIEAHRHLRKLSVRATSDSEELKKGIAAARNGQPSMLESFVRRDPMTARVYGDGTLLIAWAGALAKQDAAAAKEAFADLSALSRTIALVSGDHLLADSIAFIGDKRNAERKRLEDAYKDFADGRLLYDKRDVKNAQGKFHNAVRLAGNAPLKWLASYYEANTLFDVGDAKKSDAMLTVLREQTDAGRFPGLVAQIEWQSGRSAAYTGQWSLCLMHLERSRAIFARRGEVQLAAFIDGIIAETYDRLGQVEQGWRHRVMSFDALSRGGNLGARRLQAVLSGAIRAEIFRRQYSAALSLAEIAVNRPSGAPTPEHELKTEALTRRARIVQLLNEPRQTATAIDEARNAAASIQDPSLRARALIEVNIIEAVSWQKSNPAAAVTPLSSAIDFYRVAGETMWIPPLYLERGRTFRILGDRAKARADFMAAIREVEAQRSTVTGDDLRSCFFDTEPDLFSETADMLIEDGDDAAAFAVLERAHARTLAEQLGIITPQPNASLPAIQHALRKDELLVAYALVPGGIAIFTVDSRSVTVKRVAVQRDDLRRLTATLRRAIFERAPLERVQRASADVRQLLIAPVSDQLTGAKRLIIVPDRFLFDVPYAALFDLQTRRYLAGTHVITVAPSATLLLKRVETRSLQPALVIGDPQRADDVSLPAALMEAERIAGSYENATLLTGRNATVNAFSENVTKASLVHYAGHARNDDIAGLLPFSGTSGGSDVLTAADITRFRLTRSPLVVLAACGTMRGNAEHVEGAPTIARAFLAAGARSVVGTLWDIPDRASARFFAEFHRQLRADGDPAEALARTQRAFLTSNDRAHPSAWSAAEVFGAN